MCHFRLETRFNAAATREDTGLEMTLHNLSDRPLAGARLGFSAQTRIADDAVLRGADLSLRTASYHEFAMPEGMSVPPGGIWHFGFTGVALHIPKHRCDGPKSAVLHLNGQALPVSVGDLARDGETGTGARKTLPDAPPDLPLFLQPWPAEAAIAAWGPTTHLAPADDTDPDDRAALANVAALHGRLFPDHTNPLRLDTAATRIRFTRTDRIEPEAFSLDFDGAEVTLGFADTAGRLHGLIALAQIAHAAFAAPDLFRFPVAGHIADAPRFGYRAAHLDVSRHFWTVDQVRRLLDCMAWARMNRFQWHLTDDEGWRIEIDAYPELTDIGAVRGPGCALVGQLGHIDRPYAGHYTKDQIRAVVAHAAGLGIEVIPEIDIPGHATAVLAALPHLADPDEPADSYRSVQGFPNNALNPGIPETYKFIETVMAEVADLFPARWIHVGADEVPDGAWLRSPRVQVLMQREGLQGTAQIQSHFLRRVQRILRGLGRELAGWDEVAHGGGVDQSGTLLIAWQKPELVRGLTELGYQVVASPGQAYYLDMVQADGWEEPGASWAGTVTPERCYAFDPEGGLAEAERGALAGVQACIWCEHILTPEVFNHMVFPRLYAVAEAGWTPQPARDWQRFAALTRYMPQL
ncbi:beta-N-acetylhexosaminidase [Tropicimonas sp. IMCC34043]|uniref:beta-N-acetylhexosaminidase n=1 Tax=Tropicimonas sp. IMCC34043 TaxID=2248760 RepID=UPI000E26AD37|nr:family 20 glycosylhydrolase [Tropicimonas sp. IMCC34043]